MEILWLEDFLTLSVTGNFSRAAELRNVTQPAFSRRIRNLENWVGAPLIDRSVYPVVLTPAGVAFRKVAEETIRSLRTAREEARGTVARSSEVVSFKSLHVLAVNYFPEWLRSLQPGLGDTKTRLSADNLAGCVDALMSGACDLMLCYSHHSVPTALDMNRYPSLKLVEDRLLPVCAPDENGDPRFPIYGDRPIPYLCYPHDSFLGRMVAPIIAANHLEKRLVFQYENSMAEALIPFAVAGSGVAWVPQMAIRRELQAGQLVGAGGPEHMYPVNVRLYRSLDRSRHEVERLWSHARCLTPQGAT